MNSLKYRQFIREESVVFLKTNEQFGGLSNMAGGYSLKINHIKILTSEALYQACRFPHLPEVQKMIIGQTSPMTAKMKSKPYRRESRADWDEIRVYVMYWCLRVKLAQHWEKFGSLLLSTGDKPIVEESHRDQFWGAKPVDANTLVGSNTLGYLLTRLRKQLLEAADELQIVKPLNIADFLLMEQPIETIYAFVPPGNNVSILPGPQKNSLPLEKDTESLPVISQALDHSGNIQLSFDFL